jgi:hypothetical protein
LDGKITAKGLRVPNIKSKDIKKLVPSKAPKTEVKSMQERVAETQATLQIIEDARTVDIAPVQKNAEKKKVVVSKLDEALLL